MALKFQDFGLSADEAVREREKAYDKYINIAQPAYKQKEAAERGELASQVSRSAAQAAQAGRPDQISGLVAEAQAKAAEMLPQQGIEKLQLNSTGAKLKEDIIAGRQRTSLDRYLRDTEEAKDQASTALAKKAFELGIQGKELTLHQNSMIADIGMNQLFKDLQAGRVNEKEIRQLQASVALAAAKYKQQFEAEKAKLQGELEIEVARKNIAGAKARLSRLLELAKKAAKEQARSNNLSAILSGTFGVVGAVVGGYFGGPVGAAAGAKIGSSAGGLVANEVDN